LHINVTAATAAGTVEYRRPPPTNLEDSIMTEQSMDGKGLDPPVSMGPLTPAELRRVTRWLNEYPKIAEMFSIPEIAERLERQYGPARDEE
jgi:hypothetical protein